MPDQPLGRWRGMVQNGIALTGRVIILTIGGLTAAALAQKGGAPVTTTPTTTAPTNTPTTTNPNRTTTPTTQQQQPYDMGQRPIFLSGKVVMDDGTPPPESVVIERVCGGNPRPEAWTDSKGHFSFQLGQNTAMMADA